MDLEPDTALACLTFDDGPDPVWTPRILDALSDAEVRATFFVVSPLVREHPHLIRRMTSEGHEVALHCERHIRHTELSEDEIRTDTRRGLEGLASVGVEPKNWRPPWGIVTNETERVANEFGLRLVHWTEDTHDWRGDSSGEMLRQIGGNLRDGSIVLMHDGLGPGATRDGCTQTLALIPQLVETLRQKRLQTATVSELSREEASVLGGMR